MENSDSNKTAKTILQSSLTREHIFVVRKQNKNNKANIQNVNENKLKRK